MRVKLTGLSGEDSSEFADLLGTVGQLESKRGKATYLPDGRGDWVAIVYRHGVESATTKTITSNLGNTFTFKILEEPECGRCGTPLRRGRCKDETCPFSDHAQDCAAGWRGHPEKDRGRTVCTCKADGKSTSKEKT